jgi:hypothetical protein
MIALPPQGGTTESGLRIAEKKDPLKKRVVFFTFGSLFLCHGEKDLRRSRRMRGDALW